MTPLTFYAQNQFSRLFCPKKKKFQTKTNNNFSTLKKQQNHTLLQNKNNLI